MGTARQPADAGSRRRRSRPSPPAEAKRTLTRENAARTLADLAVAAPVLLPALLKPKVAPALREQIMLAVTAVNECRYCQWGHTRLATAQGVPLEEVNEILGYQSLEARSSAEAAAILFAQDYAENHGAFDPTWIGSLRAHYSEAQVAEILAYVRAITFGNLAGNTVDALVDRVRSAMRRAQGRGSRRPGDTGGHEVLP